MNVIKKTGMKRTIFRTDGFAPNYWLIAGLDRLTYTRPTMKQRTSLLLWTTGLVAALLAACTLNLTPTPNPNAQIRQAVAATLAAMPSPTSPPTMPVRPSPTPFNLSGLFCEYSFCIGHPNYVSFVDKKAIDNPQLPSKFDNGELTAYNQNPLLVIYFIWLHAPGTSDSQFLLDTIISDNIDTRAGNMDVRLIRDMNVIYVPISSTISPDLPYGGAASWVCGDRVFAWKAYTPDSTQADGLFQEAIGRFQCD